MRLGAPLSETYSDPDSWVKTVKAAGYRAAYCPVDSDADSDTIRAYAAAARAANIVIAEVGAWGNPISPDESERRAAIAKCQRQLTLADQIGARCCVNVAGSRSAEHWYAPHPDNFTQDTFDLIVETTRGIIDAVKPERTFFTLEPMPWIYPHSIDSYLELMDAIDRERFAVHLDPVNIITSPWLFLHNAEFIRDCFARLGPHIKSVHGKDMTLSNDLTVHLGEVRPGLGGVDYRALLMEMDKLHPDTPFMLEHLPQEEYLPAAEYVRSVARAVGITLVT